jgi:hypothetical protein
MPRCRAVGLLGVRGREGIGNEVAASFPLDVRAAKAFRAVAKLELREQCVPKLELGNELMWGWSLGTSVVFESN